MNSTPERLAISALQDADDLADGAELEPHHPVEEDRPIVVGFLEAVGARIKLGAILRRLQTERIEIGMKRTADAVGADQHQGVERIARCLLHLGGRHLDAAALGAGLEPLADRASGLLPVAGQRARELVTRQPRPVRLFP